MTGDGRLRHHILDLPDVLQHQFETRQLALDFPAAPGRERLAVTSPQFGQRLAPVLAERPIIPHAMQREQALDTVDVAHPLLGQSREFAMWPALILLFDAGNADEQQAWRSPRRQACNARNRLSA